MSHSHNNFSAMRNHSFVENGFSFEFPCRMVTSDSKFGFVVMKEYTKKFYYEHLNNTLIYTSSMIAL